MSRRRHDVRKARRAELAERDLTEGELAEVHHHASSGWNPSRIYVLAMHREIARRRAEQRKTCKHVGPFKPGKRAALRWGSSATEVCVCGAWRTIREGFLAGSWMEDMSIEEWNALPDDE